jgi:hypothetical protein
MSAERPLDFPGPPIFDLTFSRGFKVKQEESYKGVWTGSDKGGIVSKC